MSDPNIVTGASKVSSLLESTSVPPERLFDRSRGVMLGLAVGNLLGLPVEGWNHREIDRSYPEGVTDIDPREAVRPMDDDLAQAVDLGEALLEGGDHIGSFARRLVTWARENGRGMGILTGRVIQELESGHAPPDAARLVYESNRIAPNGGVMRCAPVALARHRLPVMLVRDSAASCVVTHYAVTCQWSCIIVNAVIAMLLRGVEPDLRALMYAAAADGAPDMLATALDDGIPAGVLSAIEDGAHTRRLLAAPAADADRSHAAGGAVWTVGRGHAAGPRGCAEVGGGGRRRHRHECGRCWRRIGRQVRCVGDPGPLAGVCARA